MKKIDSAVAAFTGDDAKKKSKKTRKLDMIDTSDQSPSLSKNQSSGVVLKSSKDGIFTHSPKSFFPDFLTISSQRLRKIKERKVSSSLLDPFFVLLRFLSFSLSSPPPLSRSLSLSPLTSEFPLFASLFGGGNVTHRWNKAGLNHCDSSFCRIHFFLRLSIL